MNLLLQMACNNYANAPLNGCLQDLKNLDKFFDSRNIRFNDRKILTEAQMTRDAMLRNIEWAVKTKADTKIIQFSGHGARIPSLNNDREKYDSTWVPYDYEKSGLILDDEIGQILSQNTSGRIVILSDSCHSGGLQRNLVFNFVLDFARRSKVRALSESVSFRLADKTRKISPRSTNNRSLFGRTTFINNSEATVLIATCKPDQTSADAYINGMWQGAGTASLLYAINKLNKKNQNFSEVASLANKWLKENKYTQVLRVEAKKEYRDDPIFFLA